MPNQSLEKATWTIKSMIDILWPANKIKELKALALKGVNDAAIPSDSNGRRIFDSSKPS